MLTDFARQAAVVGGIGLAMSSTAMALQLMREKGMNRSESGQLGFSVLLFQDLAVIPALALVPLLAGSADEHFDWMKIGMKVLAFVGMSLNLGVLYTHLLWVVISVVVLVAVKILVLYLLARLYGVRSSERMQFAGVLSQGGEFAFVLFSTASSQRLFRGDQMALLLVTVTLSMMTTPLLMKLVDKWLSRQFNGPEEEDEKPWVNDDKPGSLSWASGVLVR